MSKEIKLGVFAGVVLLVGLIAGVYLASLGGPESPAPVSVEDPDAAGGSLVENNQTIFVNGLRNRNQVERWEDITIAAGSNAGAWTNTLGRDVYVPHALTRATMSGSLSSSTQVLYVATTTPGNTAFPAVDAYRRPVSPWYFIIDGATTATGTPIGNVPITGTSTKIGASGFNWDAGYTKVPNGGTVVAQWVAKFGCKTIGVCETASSTNNGYGETKVALPILFTAP